MSDVLAPDEAAIDRAIRAEDAAEKARRRAMMRESLLAEQKAAQDARERRQAIEHHNREVERLAGDLEAGLLQVCARADTLAEDVAAVLALLPALSALDPQGKAAPLGNRLGVHMMTRIAATLSNLPLPLRRPQVGPYTGNDWPRRERADWVVTLKISED